ncbi:DoxX family protein [Nocardia sp. NPDC050710]|uniref:DoxX family protein n=1 Tax=Nocardia sp. NPDC050710 TaxID=3157220 RepID=UPI0033FDD3A8
MNAPTTNSVLLPSAPEAATANRVVGLINSVTGTTWAARAKFAAFAVTSGIVLTESVVGAYWDLARVPYVEETFAQLQYPMYFATILGTAKLLAVGAVVAPGFPRLKEWAYAGLVFVYAGASASHLAIGDPAAKWIGPLVFTGLTLVSWALRAPAQRDPKPLSKSFGFLRRARG